jgi:hypothetical protein
MVDDHEDLSNVGMSTRAREHYERDFLPRYRAFLQEVDETPLTVLVWGPGQSGGDLYEKRRQIRGRLRVSGVAAVFSEEIDQDCPDTTDASSKGRELLQALSADLIVILQSSPGSTAEAHDFGAFIEDVGRKMLIFIDERAKGGYSFTGALRELNDSFHNVHTFQYPKDIEECHLTAAVLRRVRVLRHAKWRRERVK